ncbi:catechol 2,3-dioxygenase-like lactoylglutathione lyase family enzyme [Rubricella aquisinus]|uniref:Catechol 2,3-dioxygenase-like lactoylglutathione lyase family enzyme n=1 Tax=Rubricella aquisinus TaxID=2028108 RepID=A0A840WV18_9RHOB|nr:VOC family protein [Rubricella aquisinus]MBB5515050.1 catechol 2,3-dioxygenase-like lactoylglutathione lyase family enzyme [Rubricella aquisinus]
MKMNYCVVGTNDMEAATSFYSALFAQAELATMFPTDRMTYWIGVDFAFAVAKPFDGQPSTRGNGTMVGFNVGIPEEVNRLHALALTLGGTNEGDPGQRGPKYSAYLRDLDGNKICLSD